MSCFISKFLFSIVLFCIVSQNTAQNPVFCAVDQDQPDDYYRFWEGIADQSLPCQIELLKKYQEKHPHFDKIYFKILERYFLNQDLGGAKVYFSDIVDKRPYLSGGLWVLAKIEEEKQNPDTAFVCYKRALSAKTNSIELLLDFLDFDFKYSGKYKSLDIIDELDVLDPLNKLAKAYFFLNQGKYVQAHNEFERLPDDFHNQLIVLYKHGYCLNMLYKYGAADSIYHKGLESAKKCGNVEYQSLFFVGLGYNALKNQQVKLARAYCDSANVIAEPYDDLNVNEKIYGYLGIVCNRLGLQDEAFENLKKAIKAAEYTFNNNELALWYFHLGNVYFQLGKYSNALNTFENSESNARKWNKPKQLISTIIRKGDLLLYLNQDEFAKKVFERAFDLSDTYHLADLKAKVVVKLADILITEKQFDKACQIYREYIDKQSNEINLLEKAYCYWKVGKTFRLQKKYDQAREEYVKSYNIAKQAHSSFYESWYLINLACLDVFMDDIQGATLKYEKAIKIAKEINNSLLLRWATSEYARAIEKTGDTDQAITLYKRAIDIIEKDRQNVVVEDLRVGYLSSTIKAYRGLINCYFKRYQQEKKVADLDSLFYYEEMSKSRSLKDIRYRERNGALENRRKLLERNEDAQRELAIRQHVLRYQAGQCRSVDEWEELMSSLEAAKYSVISQRLKTFASPGEKKNAPGFNIPCLKDMQKRMGKKKQGLLLYHIAENTSFVLAVTGDRVKVIPLYLNTDSLSADIDSLIAPFHHVEDGDILQAPFRANIAHRLYTMLVKPVEKKMDLPEQILVVPDFAIMNLPFELLLVQKPIRRVYFPNEQPVYVDNFLLHRYTFYYSPTSLIEGNKESLFSGQKILVFANPFTQQAKGLDTALHMRFRTGWRFDPLPFTEMEAEHIKKIYRHTTVFKRDRAKESVFIQEAPNYDILHFATHAFVDTSFGAFSGMVLAASQDSTEDGLLMGYEIANLHLPCDLVTLSACETGRGRHVKGEGVLGLPRLFLGAGANTVLMTLWKVDDQFTSILLPTFYDMFLNKNLSKANALKRAKRIVVNKNQSNAEVFYQHPLFWAAFVMYGEPGESKEPESPVPYNLVMIFVGLNFGVGLLVYRRYTFHKRCKKPGKEL